MSHQKHDIELTLKDVKELPPEQVLGIYLQTRQRAQEFDRQRKDAQAKVSDQVHQVNGMEREIRQLTADVTRRDRVLSRILISMMEENTND